MLKGKEKTTGKKLQERDKVSNRDDECEQVEIISKGTKNSLNRQ